MEVQNIIVAAIVFIGATLIFYLFFDIIKKDADHKGWLRGYREARDAYEKHIEQLKLNHKEYLEKITKNYIKSLHETYPKQSQNSTDKSKLN